jgi:hypothetical protein
MAAEFLEIDDGNDPVFVDHDKQQLYCVIRPRSERSSWDVCPMMAQTNTRGADEFSYTSIHQLTPEEHEHIVTLAQAVSMGLPSPY